MSPRSIECARVRGWTEIVLLADKFHDRISRHLMASEADILGCDQLKFLKFQENMVDSLRPIKQNTDSLGSRLCSFPLDSVCGRSKQC
jgi:hypothetical protein